MRYPQRLFPLLATALLATACESAPETTAEAAYDAGDPLPGLTEEQTGRFLLGKALFTRLTSPEEGLGPTYNQTRCSACHTLPDVGGSGTTERTLGKAPGDLLHRGNLRIRKEVYRVGRASGRAGPGRGQPQCCQTPKPRLLSARARVSSFLAASA